MKKLLLISFVFLQSTFLFSQSLVVSGDSIIYGDPTDFQLESHLLVENLTSDSIQVICEKIIISQNQTGTNNFCWGGQCYGESTFISTQMETIQVGGTSTTFSGYYQPWSTPGIAKIEYCFYLDTDTNNQTCFTITYDASKQTDIKDVISSDKIGSFYPNPTKEYTNFTYNVNGLCLLQITDVLGNVVKTFELEGSGEKSIYVADLYKGIYFGNLIENGEIVKIKKLIINK